MEDQSNKQPDQSSSNEGKLAFLTIGVDNNGIVDYNVNWQPEEEGLIAIATIFHKLIVDNLSIQILEEIRQQCVLNGNEEDYVNLINIISALALDNISNETNSVDDIVVPPDRVFSI